MKFTLFVAAAAAIKLGEPWDPKSLPDCPDDTKRTLMDDHKTHVVPWPYVGATCFRAADNTPPPAAAPTPTAGADPAEDVALQLRDPVSWDPDTLPDCPADPKRTKMDDMKTHVTKYPYVGATCKLQIGETALIMTGAAPSFDPTSVEHCPDFDERMTLKNGKTRAIPYPQAGWNCNPEFH